MMQDFNGYISGCRFSSQTIGKLARAASSTPGAAAARALAGASAHTTGGPIIPLPVTEILIDGFVVPEARTLSSKYMSSFPRWNACEY